MTKLWNVYDLRILIFRENDWLRVIFSVSELFHCETWDANSTSPTSCTWPHKSGNIFSEVKSLDDQRILMKLISRDFHLITVLSVCSPLQIHTVMMRYFVVTSFKLLIFATKKGSKGRNFQSSSATFSKKHGYWFWFQEL